MNLKLENPRYTNVYGTEDGKRESMLSFDLTITDLDGVINDGEPFEYTYVDYVNESDNDAVREYIKEHIKDIIGKIAWYYSDPDPSVAIYDYYYYACKDIDDDCDLFMKTYDAIYYNDDLYRYDLQSITIMGSIIDCYKSQIDMNLITEDKVAHDYISASNVIHTLSYQQLVELRSKMVMRYSEVKLHARKLKDQIYEADTVDKIKEIRWDLWDL